MDILGQVGIPHWVFFSFLLPTQKKESGETCLKGKSLMTKETKRRMEVPDAYMCPITQELMRDPVIAQDGFSYEREAITKWFSVGRKTSPITNSALECTYIFPNRVLKAAIADFIQEQRVLLREALIGELAKVETNALLDSHHPLVKCSLSSVSDSVLDTFAVLQGVLAAWKQDADVCEAALEALVAILGCCTTVDEDSDMTRLARLGTFPAVMDLLLRYEGLGSIQAAGLRYIQHYAKAYGSVKTAAMHILRAYEIVSSAMRCHPLHRGVQMEAAKAVEVLGMHLPSNSLRLGISKALAKAVHNFPDDEDVVVAVCLALTQLTTGACARLCQAGLCRKIAEAMLLFPKSRTLQLPCCLALGKMSHSKSLCDDAPCDVVARCLQEFAQDSAMTAAACGAVARLASVRRAALRLGAVGACEMVLKVLGKALVDAREEVVAAAVRALDMLTIEEESNRAVLANKATCQALGDALTLHVVDHKIVLSCIRCLLNLSYQEPDFALVAAQDCRVAKKVIQGMRRHLAEVEIQDVGWWCLEVLAKTQTMEGVDAFVMGSMA
jgi:hypothetical protein